MTTRTKMMRMISPKSQPRKQLRLNLPSPLLNPLLSPLPSPPQARRENDAEIWIGFDPQGK